MTCIDRVGRQNPSAEAETREGDGKGSLLYRLHMWYMRWGNTHEGMQMVRRFAEKEITINSTIIIWMRVPATE